MTEQTTGANQERDSNGYFLPGQSGNPAGRPIGSKNKVTKARHELLGPILPEAVQKLHEAVQSGEKWAIELVIGYSLPRPKPVDTEEMAEFDERMQKLEERLGAKS